MHTKIEACKDVETWPSKGTPHTESRLLSQYLLLNPRNYHSKCMPSLDAIVIPCHRAAYILTHTQQNIFYSQNVSHPNGSHTNTYVHILSKSRDSNAQHTTHTSMQLRNTFALLARLARRSKNRIFAWMQYLLFTLHWFKNICSPSAVFVCWLCLSSRAIKSPFGLLLFL